MLHAKTEFVVSIHSSLRSSLLDHHLKFMGEPQPSNRKEFIARIGTFFLLVGIGLMVFFVLSDAANDPRLGYFCWGTILLTFGFIFRGQFKRPAGPPPGRFSIFQRLKPKPKPKEEKKK